MQTLPFQSLTGRVSLEKRKRHAIFHMIQIATTLLKAWNYFSNNKQENQGCQNVCKQNIMEITNIYHILMQLSQAVQNNHFETIFYRFFQLKCRVMQLGTHQQFNLIQNTVLASIFCLKITRWVYLSFLSTIYSFRRVIYAREDSSVNQEGIIKTNTSKFQEENKNLKKYLYIYIKKNQQRNLTPCEVHEINEISIVYLMACLTSYMFNTWNTCCQQTYHQPPSIKKEMRKRLHTKIWEMLRHLSKLNKAVYKKTWEESWIKCEQLKGAIQESPWHEYLQHDQKVIQENQKSIFKIPTIFKSLENKTLEIIVDIENFILILLLMEDVCTTSLMDVDDPSIDVHLEEYEEEVYATFP